MTTEERKRAHRALPVMIGRVVKADLSTVTFEEVASNGVVKARHCLVHSALNQSKAEELLKSGEVVTMYYTRLKLGGMSLLKFESRRLQ